jgi:hypothetical protein
MVVPSVVPSVFHSSKVELFASVRALKKTIPFTLVKFLITDELTPGAISLTKTVPTTVPSLFQSSLPTELEPTASK